MKIIEILRLKNQEGKEVGIEIEMEGGNLPAAGLNYWDAKFDGSLRGEAIEYVLKQPVERKKVAARLAYLQKYLNDKKARLAPSDRCGVHIHLNFQENTPAELFRFATLYYTVENLLIRWCGPKREGNLFCLRAGDASNVITSVSNFKSSAAWGWIGNDDVRYAALNWKALSRYGSLEFRALPTPLDFNVIAEGVDILLTLKNSINQFKLDSQIPETLSRDGPEAFLSQVMGKKWASKFLEYPDYKQLLMDGARMGQIVGYADLAAEKVWGKKKEQRELVKHMIVREGGGGRQKLRPIDPVAIENLIPRPRDAEVPDPPRPWRAEIRNPAPIDWANIAPAVRRADALAELEARVRERARGIRAEFLQARAEDIAHRGR